MEKEFEEYWSAHSKRMLLNAPGNLRQEYLESTKLDTPMDWVCYILPVAAGILIQPHVNLKSEVLSWAIILLIVVVLFVFLQMVKPFFRKRSQPFRQLIKLNSITTKDIRNMVWIKWSLGIKAPFFLCDYVVLCHHIFYTIIKSLMMSSDI